MLGKEVDGIPGGGIDPRLEIEFARLKNLNP